MDKSARLANIRFQKSDIQHAPSQTYKLTGYFLIQFHQYHFISISRPTVAQNIHSQTYELTSYFLMSNLLTYNFINIVQYLPVEYIEIYCYHVVSTSQPTVAQNIHTQTYESTYYVITYNVINIITYIPVNLLLCKTYILKHMI